MTTQNIVSATCGFTEMTRVGRLLFKVREVLSYTTFSTGSP